MLTTVYADVVLANLLQRKKFVSVRELNKIRIKIESVIPIYVDITKNCILWAIHGHPDMFKLLNDGIIEARVEWTQGYVNQFFNWHIDSSVRDQVVKILTEE